MGERWVEIELCQIRGLTRIEERDITEEEHPSIIYVREPYSNLSDEREELIARIPVSAKEKIINVWKRREELDDFELASELYTIVYEYDDNPHLKLEYNRYETKIEINPPSN